MLFLSISKMSNFFGFFIILESSISKLSGEIGFLIFEVFYIV